LHFHAIHVPPASLRGVTREWLPWRNSIAKHKYLFNCQTQTHIFSADGLGNLTGLTSRGITKELVPSEKLSSQTQYFVVVSFLFFLAAEDSF